jgi:hypothetical protein
MEKKPPNFLTYLFGVIPWFGVTLFYGTGTVLYMYATVRFISLKVARS